MILRAHVLAVALLFAAPAACSGRGCGDPDTSPDASAPITSASPSASAEPSASAPDAAPEPSASAPDAGPAPSGKAPLLCPREMVSIPASDRVAAFCIDRFEAQLVDKASGQLFSPYYSPRPKVAVRIHDLWQTERLNVGGPRAQAVPLPPLPAFMRTGEPEPVAVSKQGVVPSGYMNGHDAARACANAGKRLCRHDEWLRACMGEKQRQYPYGDSYKPGLCNIFRSKHPAAELHDDPSQGHLDPRLNLVTEGSDPLLRKTGGTPACKSEWGDDAVYDMNGNLDEWVESEKGRFVGGFFSRSKKDGCLSSVGAHPKEYFDYSTGVRCCLADGG